MLRLILLFFVSLAHTLVASQAFAVPGDVGLTLPTVASPKTQVGDKELQADYDRIWADYHEAIAVASKTVTDEVERLYGEAKSSGNLELVLFWDSLKKSLTESGKMKWEPASQKKDWAKRFGDAVFPDGFTAVLRKSEASVDEAKADLENGYKRLVAELTKRDKLTQAQAIKTELASIWTQTTVNSPRPTPKPDPTPTVPKPVPQKSLLERMAGKWTHQDHMAVFHIEPNGNITEVLKRNGQVNSHGRLARISSDVGEVRFNGGYKCQMGLVGENTLAMVWWEPNGNPIRGWFMERVK